MKTSVEHLPEGKQNELQEIVQVLRRGKGKKIEIVILFGSHARGDWVEDRYVGEDGIVYEYRSDFDILVVTTSIQEAQRFAHWASVEEKLHRNPMLRTWVSLIVIDIKTLNNELSKGRYFYKDIQEEGIVLFDSENCELLEGKELSPEEMATEAKLHYEKWFFSANEFLLDFRNAFERGSWLKAAFELHQATERFFMTILLVFSNYKPKLHDLKKLNHLAIEQHRSFIEVFPQNTEEEKQNFLLLKRAYIDSRYHMEKYDISPEQLQWLAGRVERLKALTEKNCQEKIIKLSE